MDAFRHAPIFSAHLREGKRSIKGEHKPLLIESEQARVLSSLDFEAALANQDLDCKRFDYFIESSRSVGRCHAIEVHAFKPSELMEKKQGTLTLLARHCPDASPQVASWNVLVRGAMPRLDLIARLRADSRITTAGRSLMIEKL